MFWVGISQAWDEDSWKQKRNNLKIQRWQWANKKFLNYNDFFSMQSTVEQQTPLPGGRTPLY
jgi:hypothetical protein